MKWIYHGELKAKKTKKTKTLALFTIKRRLQRPTQHHHSSIAAMELSTAVISPWTSKEHILPKRSDLTNVLLYQELVSGAAAGKSGQCPYKWFGTFVSVSWWYQDSELPCTEEQPSVRIQTYWVRQSGWVVDSWLEIPWQWALRMTMIPMPSAKHQFMLRQQFKIHWSDRSRECIAQDRWF